MAKTTDIDENQDRLYNFRIGLRDSSASNHWREINKKYPFAKRKTVLVLPGSAAHSAQDANGMCKVVENMISEKERKNVDICSLYYPEKTKHREGSAERALGLLDEYIIPLVSKQDKEGYFEKISADKAAKNLRNLILFTHCYGTYMVEAIDAQLSRDLRDLGYSEQEANNIQKQLFVVHHNSISDKMGKVKMKSTNLFRLTQADEHRKDNMFSSDGFQYFVQTELLNKDEALYVKVGENVRALVVRQITEEGEDEHNGAYWHDDKKSEGGEKERETFEFIFNEAVRSNYPLDNIEELIRQGTRLNPEMEDELQPILEGGQEYGDEYKEIRRDILNKVKDIREKQLADDLKEKEVKTLSPEVLLYLDNNDKSFLDYALESENVVQTKVLWNAIRKMLPKKEALYELDYEHLSRNYTQAFQSNKMYLQLMLDLGKANLFSALAKGSTELTTLDYKNTDNETLLSAAKVYSGLPANTGQLDRLHYYDSLIYMYSRIEKMEQTAETEEICKTLDSRIFTKSNAKDAAVKYKIKAYASRYEADTLMKKCLQNWNDKPLLKHNNTEFDKQP